MGRIAICLGIALIAGAAAADDGVDIEIDVPGARVSIHAGDDGGSVEIHAGNVHISAAGDNSSGTLRIDAPGARVIAGSDVEVSSSELGLPDYPGADLAAASRVEAGDTKVVSRRLSTEDTYEKVVLYYVDHLSGYVLQKTGGSGNREAAFERIRDDDTSAVRIREEKDDVVIEISRSEQS